MLLKNLPETSEFKTVAERDGNWPEWLQILKELHKETALHRASLYAGGDHEYEPQVYLDPIERVERFTASVAETEVQEEAESQFFADLGFS